MTTRSIHWFREDLRLSDNPSLFEACKSGHVIPIYIHDNCYTPELGKVSRWWLHHSLAKLDKSLDGKLRIFTGDTTDILMQVNVVINFLLNYQKDQYLLELNPL